MAEVLAGYVDRLNAGERIDEDEIRNEYPDIAAILVEELATFERQSDLECCGASTVLGDYRLYRTLGRGGMGVVYEAWQSSVGRPVALKLLPPALAADKKARTRFLREARIAAKVAHPNLVPVYGLGIEDHVPYYAMELVEGETLAQILARMKDAEPGAETPFGASRDDQMFYSNLGTAFAGVADGLQHAHSKGVIHRDIKPSNLILDQEGRLRILDFGLAHLEGQESLTVSGDVVGTPVYMSPEQAKRRKIPIDHRTDIYSLGATMYEMLAGRPPFKGKDHQDTLSRIIEEEPSPLRRFNRCIPRDFETIVLKCLRKDPRDRYASAEALACDLRCFVRGDPIEARPRPAWAVLGRRLWKHRLKVGGAVMIVALLLIFGPLMLEPEEMVVRRVWNAPASAGPQAISPDGRYISYRDRELGGLALHEIATGKSRFLTKGHASPIFSPDGKQVAYTGYKEGWYDLRVIGIDGSNPRVLYRSEEAEVVYVGPVAWSPDGKHILAIFSRGKPQQIVWVSVADGSVRVLKNFRRMWPRTICLSPDGRTIAYEFPPRTGDIYLLAADGSKTPLVEHPASDFVLGWAPDGKRVLFASDRTGTWDAWLIHVADGKPQGKPELVRPDIGSIRPMGFRPNGSYYYSVATRMNDVYIATLDPETGKVVDEPVLASQRMVGSNSDPDWSPDGQSLAYLSQRNDLPRGPFRTICIRSVDKTKTGEERQLSHQLSIQKPRWSSDSRSLIAGGWDNKGDRGIYQIDAETGDVSVIKQGRVFQPEWTPDGNVIFVSSAHGGRSSILVRDLETGQEKELARVPGRVQFALSADGRRVAFTTKERETESVILKVMPVTGGDALELFRVQEPEGIKEPEWTPDGRYLIFRREGRKGTSGIWRIPAEGGEHQRLELGMRGVRDLRVHPDGRRVAFTASPQKGRTEVWVMENFLPPQ